MGLHFPWESSIVLQTPLLLPLTMVAVALLLSMLTWFKRRKK